VDIGLVEWKLVCVFVCAYDPAMDSACIAKSAKWVKMETIS